jgi:transcriptional regulator GlxA family with amidase domain
MQDRSAATRFGVVIYPGAEAIEIGGTVGFILMARRVPPAIEAVTIPAEPRSVAIVGSLDVLVESGYADAPAYDRVILCGGPGWAAADDPALCALLRRRPAVSLPLSAGALVLAATGVLDGRAAEARRTPSAAMSRSPSTRSPI